MDEDECRAFEAWLDADASNVASLGFDSGADPDFLVTGSTDMLAFGCNIWEHVSNGKLYVYYDRDESEAYSTRPGHIGFTATGCPEGR